MVTMSEHDLAAASAESGIAAEVLAGYAANGATMAEAVESERAIEETTRHADTQAEKARRLEVWLEQAEKARSRAEWQEIALQLRPRTRGGDARGPGHPDAPPQQGDGGYGVGAGAGSDARAGAVAGRVARRLAHRRDRGRDARHDGRPGRREVKA